MDNYGAKCIHGVWVGQHCNKCGPETKMACSQCSGKGILLRDKRKSVPCGRCLGSRIERSRAPVEGVERVTDDAPAMVEAQVDVWRGTWGRPEPGIRRDIIGVRDLPDGRKEYLMHNEALGRPYYLAVSAPPAQPAKHTDDESLKFALAQLANRTEGEARALVEVISCRLGFGHAADLKPPATEHTHDRPAETIPADLRVDWSTLNEPYVTPVTLAWAIERDQNMQQFAKKVIERTGRAETRIEVLEAALRRIVSDFETDYVLDGVVVDDPPRVWEMGYDIARAALAGEKTP